MKRVLGRCMYIVSLAEVIDGRPAAEFAKAGKDAHLSAIWIRVGRGPNPADNLTLPGLANVKAELGKQGIELWGWHVPFCAKPDAARHEAELVATWLDAANLDGLIVDAERTKDSPRFRGGANEATIYCEALGKVLRPLGKGFAFSSHDQPALHTDLPFGAFLDVIPDVCPQVYYNTTAVQTRLKKSMDQYRTLIGSADFVDRYKPTGNISMGGDVGFKTVKACVQATETFVAKVTADGFTSYGFWCWDEAPSEVLAKLAELPP